MAMLFNSVFPWRRYPVSMMRYKNVSAQTSHSISKQAIEKAIEEMDVIMDITIEELQSLIDISIKHERNLDINPERIKVGRYYASGRPGAEWSIRKVVDHRESSNPEHDMVIYEIVEGSGERLINSCTRIQFAEWAAFEVQPKKQPGK